MSLATSFLECFHSRFDAACAQPDADVRSCWTNSTTWTQLMLRDHDAILVNAATDWGKVNCPGGSSVHREWRKFDLMVVSPEFKEEGDWWKSVPMLALEHENNDDTHVEVWNLACWRSPLKVLVTYHQDEATLVLKLKNAREIMLTADEKLGPSGSEFLFLTAPRTFGSKLAWRGFIWSGVDWELQPSPAA